MFHKLVSTWQVEAGLTIKWNFGVFTTANKFLKWNETIPITGCWRLRVHHKQVDLQGVLMMFNTYFKQEVIWYLVFKEKANYLFFHQTVYKGTGNKHQSLPQTIKNIKSCFWKSIFKLLVQNYHSLLNNKSKLSFTLCVTVKQNHRVLPITANSEHEGTGACDQHCYLQHH